jgi:hypothetical protein
MSDAVALLMASYDVMLLHPLLSLSSAIDSLLLELHPVHLLFVAVSILVFSVPMFEIDVLLANLLFVSAIFLSCCI